MAFINPYQTAQSQLGLTEALLGGEQKKKAMQTATAGQMGKMEKEFQQKVLAAQKAAEAQLSRKKKGGALGKILSFASSFAGPIAGPILSGLISGVQMKGQSDFAKRQASRAKASALGLDLDRYGGTFLGKKAREYEAGTESMYDKMISEADVGFGDLFKTALGSGVTSMAMGKATKGLKTKMGDIKAEKALEKALPKGVSFEDLSKVKPGVGFKASLPSGQTGGVGFLKGTDLKGTDFFSGKTGGVGVKSPQDLSQALTSGQGKLANMQAMMKGVTPEQLQEFQRLSESEQFGEGIFKRLLGEGSPMQQGIDTGLEEGQTNLLQRLILSLAR